MKKVGLLLLSLSFLLGGCFDQNQETKDQKDVYSSLYNAILDNSNFLNTSDYFTISAEVTAVSDTDYRYDVVVDQPRIAMMDVQMLVVDSDTYISPEERRMPSIGIYDPSESHLIPNQVYADAGYKKGLALSFLSTQPASKVKLIVVWYTLDLKTQMRAFFELSMAVVSDS